MGLDTKKWGVAEALALIPFDLSGGEVHANPYFGRYFSMIISISFLLFGLRDISNP